MNNSKTESIKREISASELMKYQDMIECTHYKSISSFLNNTESMFWADDAKLVAIHSLLKDTMFYDNEMGWLVK